ncbi:MAG: 16S rRNA (adenine(1518)-N(6)/adenine(1519)-N(6))-dimethyltransferase RsmA [Patescibacteria group bacterium]
MLDVVYIKNICSKYGIVPSRSRGQNFLIDQSIVDKIILAANLKSTDTILEVGPGLGVLTRPLSSSAKQVIAVELDKKVASFLLAEFAPEIKQNKVLLVENDIFKVNLSSVGLQDRNYKIVANLPYNITALFLRYFLESALVKPSELVVMVQKEVAERMVAGPGETSLLSLSAQFFSQPKILFEVDKSCFWPVPAVDSAVVCLKLNKKLPDVDIKKFFRLAKMGFSAKRKQLHNNLSGGLGLSSSEIKKIFIKLGLREDIRAQDLSLNDWLRLVDSFQG